METIYVNSMNIAELSSKKSKSVMALGFFDGLHLGHQKVINEANRIAKQENLLLSVMSFFPHPKSVLNSESSTNNVMYLEPIERKKQKLASLGVDLFFIVKFDKSTANIEPYEFIKEFVLNLGAVHIVCGYDFNYGSMAKGNVTTLTEHVSGKSKVTVVEKLSVGEKKISSSLIRHCLKEGDVQSIPSYLGDFYRVKWCTEKGILPFYSLPAPGTYNIIVSNNMYTFSTRALVTYDSEIILEKSPPKHHDIYTITWVENITYVPLSFSI